MIGNFVAKLSRTSSTERWLLLEAGILALIARHAVGRRDLPAARQRLLRVASMLPGTLRLPTARASLADINLAVNRLTRRTRVSDTCLYRTLMIDAMARARGLSGSIHIGFREAAHGLEGHAWYRNHEVVLAEGRDPGDFSSFTLGDER